MKTTTFLALTLAPLAALAFQFHPGAPDGFYTHEVDETGVSYNTYHGAQPNDTVISEEGLRLSGYYGQPTVAKRGRPVKSYDNNVNCYTDSVLNLDDLVSAQNSFEQWLGSGQTFSKKQNQSYKWGSAVVYWCVYGKSDSATANSFAADMALLTNEGCGQQGPGWVAHGNYKDSSNGRDQSSQSFC